MIYDEITSSKFIFSSSCSFVIHKKKKNSCWSSEYMSLSNYGSIRWKDFLYFT